MIYVVERAQLERVTRNSQLEDDKQLLHSPRNLRYLEELELLRT